MSCVSSPSFLVLSFRKWGEERYCPRDDWLYGFVRYPIYLGAFIFLAALTLVAANLLILPTLAVLYTSIGEEDAMLIDRFGDEYREYMRLTHRFIPKFTEFPDGRKQAMIRDKTTI